MDKKSDKKIKMNFDVVLTPMMHFHLIESGLFLDNSNDYILSCFLNEESKNIFSKLTLFSDTEKSNEIPKKIPINDFNSIKWLLHVTSYIISIATRIDKTKSVYVKVILNKIYYNILSEENNLLLNDYNLIVRELYLHLSMIFEDSNCLELWDYIYKKIFTISINKYSFKYDKETWLIFFKIILGLCDYSTKNPNIFTNKSINKFLFSLIFLILILSTDLTPENWNLLNNFSKKWVKNDNFFNSWQSNFINFFNYLNKIQLNTNLFIEEDHPFDNDLIFEKLENKSYNILIKFLENAQILSNSLNYGILHHAFGIIADHIRNHKVEFSPYFQRRWYIDEVFEIFSLWPLSNGNNEIIGSDPRENSITSFVLLLDQGLIRKEPKWFFETIKYFKRELKDPESTLSPLLLKKILKLICNHPIQTKDLISPIMKCLLRQLTSKRNLNLQIDDPIIISLVLTISEIYLHKSNSIGTITSVQTLIPLLFPKLHDLTSIGAQTWQLHVLTLLICGSEKHYFDLIDYIEKDPPPEFYIYLMFLPYFFPYFLKSNSANKFLINFINNSINKVIKSETKFLCFIYTLQEFISTSSRFQPLSEERTILFESLKSINTNNYKYLIDFLLISSYSLSQPLNSKILEQFDFENKNLIHFYIDDSLISFIDNKEEELQLIIRTPNGSFYFVINEILSNKETNLNLTFDESPQEIKSFPYSSNLEDAFSDNKLLNELNEIIQYKEKINFNKFNSKIPNIKFNKTISFLINSGIVISEKLNKISYITQDINNLIKIYDSIPKYDIIEIGLLHFTPDKANFPGNNLPTPLFLRFLKELGNININYKTNNNNLLFNQIISNEMNSLKFNFLYKMGINEIENINEFNEYLINLPILIIFNETGCDAIEEKFKKFNSSLIIVIKMFENINEFEDGLILIDVIKSSKKVAFPVIHKMPRLFSKRNISFILNLFSTIEIFTEFPNLINQNRLKRINILKQISLLNNDFIEFLLNSFQN